MLGLDSSLGSGSLVVLLRWKWALAAKGRDSRSTGIRFSGSPLDFRDECPCLVSLPNPLAQEKARSSPGQPEEEANRAATELPAGHAEYMIKM